jgi:hypothetical protein
MHRLPEVGQLSEKPSADAMTEFNSARQPQNIFEVRQSWKDRFDDRQKFGRDEKRPRAKAKKGNLERRCSLVKFSRLGPLGCSTFQARLAFGGQAPMSASRPLYPGTDIGRHNCAHICLPRI